MIVISKKIAICCTVLSSFAIVMLALMGMLLYARSLAFAEDLGLDELEYSNIEEFIAEAYKSITTTGESSTVLRESDHVIRDQNEARRATPAKTSNKNLAVGHNGQSNRYYEKQNMANNIEVIDLTDEPNTTINIVSSSDDDSEEESPYRPLSQPDYHLSPQYCYDDDELTPQFQSQPLPTTPKVRTPKARTPKSKKPAAKDGVDKRQLQLLKEANKANAANKALENCRTVIDKSVLEFIGDPEGVVMRTLFDESMIKYSILDVQRIPNSITWTYKRTEVTEAGCVPVFKDAPWMIIIMDGKEYLERILTYRDNPENSQSIKKYLCRMRDDLGCDIIFMVYNLSNYLKNERMKDAKQYRKTFKDRFEGTANEANSSLPQEEERSRILSLGVSELQDLRLMLEVEFKHDNPDWKFHIEFFEKTNDIINSLVRYSLSMAKLEVVRNVRSSTGLDWAINMDKDKACDPTKSTEDLTRLWITQLQQFSQVTLPIAKCIAAEYPSPCSLIDQYRSLTSSEAEKLLSALYVQRNLKRQVGPSISKRIHCFFTCEDPDVHIGLG